MNPLKSRRLRAERAKLRAEQAKRAYEESTKVLEDMADSWANFATYGNPEDGPPLAECGYCGAIFQGEDQALSDHYGRWVFKHICPDGHIENRFRPIEPVSDEEFERYRSDLLWKMKREAKAARRGAGDDSGPW